MAAITEEHPQVAVIGTGYWGKNLVRNFHNLGALRSICDSDHSTLERFSGDYPDIRAVNFGYIEDHGLELIHVDRRPAPLNIMQEFILEALGGDQ